MRTGSARDRLIRRILRANIPKRNVKEGIERSFHPNNNTPPPHSPSILRRGERTREPGSTAELPEDAKTELGSCFRTSLGPVGRPYTMPELQSNSSEGKSLSSIR